MFSQQTLNILRIAGWHESRHVDTSWYESLLKVSGFPIHRMQREFLSRFGGLYCVFDGGKMNFHFDLSMAVPHAFPENLALDSQDVGAVLSLIGERQFGTYLLAMSDCGKVYSIFDNYVDLLGESGEDAIEGMCTGRPVLPHSNLQRNELPGYDIL